MKKKEKKLNKKKVLAVLIIILVIIFIINKLIGGGNKRKIDETMLVIGDNVQDMKNSIIVDSSNNIYVSIDDIKNLYDENIYYDEANNKLITTYNKHIAILELEKTTMEINDAETKINGMMHFMEDKLYLPFSDLGLVYDFEYKYSNDTNIVIVDSISLEKKVAEVSKDVTLKNPIQDAKKDFYKLKKSDNVVVFEEKDNEYKIRTGTGIIGFINKNKLENLKTVRDNMQEEKKDNINILEDYSDIKSDYESVKLDENKYNVVLPKLLSLSEDNEIEFKVSKKGDTYKKYVEWANENNIAVGVTLSNEANVSNSMVTYNDRKAIINSIYLQLIENDYKVLNINFEKIDDINSFYRFILELTPRLKEAGIKIIVTYNDEINPDKISKIVDYLTKAKI